MKKIIELLKERILFSEKRKGEYDTVEMIAFWDGQMRCAQDLLNQVSRLNTHSPTKTERAEFDRVREVGKRLKAIFAGVHFQYEQGTEEYIVRAVEEASRQAS